MRYQKPKPEATKGKEMGRGFFDDGSFRVRYTPASCGKYDIYLFGVIEEASQFIEAIDALNGATEDDVVVVHLSTDGGSVDATDTFLHAMRNCKADVVVDASGGVHSAGTIILLAAPRFRLAENANFLIHNGSMGGWGKSSDFKAQAAFQSAYMDRTAHETYGGFMSHDEIEQMIAGKDFWMDAAEFVSRCERRDEEAMAAAGEEKTLDYDPTPK